jgi:cytochrome c-type biogenesis protein CcmH/NrfF
VDAGVTFLRVIKQLLRDFGEKIMAEIPVERNTKSGFPWWLIPLLLLLLLLPLLYFTCGRNTTVVDNTNGNANRMVTTNANANRMMNGN